MRLAHTYLLALALTAAGCGNTPLPQNDGSPNNDLSVVVDMGPVGADLSVGDLSIPDMLADNVSFTQFLTDVANAICARQVECGQLPNDPASIANCFQEN